MISTLNYAAINPNSSERVALLPGLSDEATVRL
jgi:hypothetical protein